jgi:hypothetical protein
LAAHQQRSENDGQQKKARQPRAFLTSAAASIAAVQSMQAFVSRRVKRTLKRLGDNVGRIALFQLSCLSSSYRDVKFSLFVFGLTMSEGDALRSNPWHAM